jgi:lipopolysaccharide transport system permease protein
VAIPASSALSGLVDFVIAFVVLIGMMFYYHIPLSVGLLLWPVLLIPLVVLVLGVGMILSSLNVKYRDIKYAIPFFIQSWLFITPIIYPTSIIPERFRPLINLNPLSGLIDAFRASMLPTRDVNWNSVLISVAVTAVIFLFAAYYFKKTEREFADII